MSNVDFDKLAGKQRAEMLVIAETDALPRHLVSARKELARDLEYRLKEVLLGMHESPDGMKILKKLDNTTKFDLFNVSQTDMQVKLLDVFFSRSAK
ncbi:MAG: phosphate/phosphite/phosphonate ABC transporter substrate-binding protein [Deltaproteobacteria bacterium]|nr:phosphate/phosphite/phosphonate ABC transporter substrate-binding protein [Deltaproteobacteria bacterium]